VTVTAWDNTGKSVTKAMPVSIDNNAPQNLSVKISGIQTIEETEFYTMKALDKLAFTVDALAGSKLKKYYRIGNRDDSETGDGYADLSGLKNALKGLDYADEDEIKIWFKVEPLVAWRKHTARLSRNPPQRSRSQY
jgi:hypothetical protein